MSNLYKERVELARKQFLELTKENEKELLKIYNEAGKIIFNELKENKDLGLEIEYQKRLRRAIHQYSKELNERLASNVKESMKKSSNIANSIQIAYIDSVVADDDIKTMFNRITVASSKKALDKIVRSDFYSDGKSLDKRIWNITQKNAKDIDTLIKINVAKGANARKLAEQLETYISPYKRVEAKTLEVGMNKSISYQAQRLARTSISHAFSETCVENAKVNPFNNGLKWNLSLSHYERQVKRWGEDECDTYANQNDYGLGTGVFPADEYPIKHPNCLCYSTYVNTPINQASKELKEWADGGRNDKLDKWYDKHNNDIKPESKKDNKPSTDLNKKSTSFNDKKDITKHLKNKYDIKFSDSKKYPAEKDLLEDMVNWMDNFNSTFKGFKDITPVKLPAIKVSGNMKSVGTYTYYINEPGAVDIKLNGLFFSDKDYNENYVKKCIESKWTVANAQGHKTFVHEYGHYVADSLKWLDIQHNNYSGNDWVKDFINDTIKEYNKVYNENISMKDLCNVVSRYGGSKPTEAFAETFAEYFGGDNPRSFAKVFGSRVEKLLNKYI